MESKIEITSIWEGDDLFEVKFFASNGKFSGEANCYTLRSEIEKFSILLAGFPKSIDDEVLFNTGSQEHGSYFSCHFLPTYRTANFKVKVTVVHIITYTDYHQENDRAEFEFDIEAVEIDKFVDSLLILSKSPVGEARAVLNGKA